MDRELGLAMLEYTAQKMPAVREAAKLRYTAGEKVEDLMGLISDGTSMDVPEVADVMTREELGFPETLEAIRSMPGDGHEIADQVAARDPNTFYVLTIYRGRVMFSPVPVTLVESVNPAA